MTNFGYVGTNGRCPGCGQTVQHDEIVLGLEEGHYSLAEYVHVPTMGKCGVVLEMKREANSSGEVKMNED